jgi:hypothetical protein
MRRDLETTVRLYGGASALRKTIGAPLLPGHRAQHDGVLAGVRELLSREAFSAAWSAGERLPLELAIAEALTVARSAASGSADAP